jgi:methyl-accepting chemotaxis protein PixJ
MVLQQNSKSVSKPIASKSSNGRVGKKPLPNVSETTNKGSWWESLGLLTKATIVSVAAITVPLLAIGGFTYFYVGQTTADSTKESKTIRAEGMGYRVAYFMRERYGDIQVLANSSIFTNRKIQASVSVADQKAILENFIKTYLVYDSIALYRLDGNLIIDAGSLPSSANASKLDFFAKVLETDKPSISPPQISPVTKEVVVFVAAPVKDISSGKTTAIIRSRIKVATFNDVVKDFSEGGEQYHLVGADNKFFVALEKDQVGRNLKEEFPSLAPLVEKRKIGAAASIDSLTSREQFAGYAPLPKLDGLPELGWSTVIALDTDISLKPVRQLLLILLTATGVLGVLAAVLAIAITRRATRPIIEATEAVVELGKGNLDTRLTVQGQDEMAQLGDNINYMASQLQNILDVQAAEVRLSEIRAEISRLQDNTGLNEMLIQYLDRTRTSLQCDRAVVYEFDAVFAGRIIAESVDTGWSSAFDAGLNDPCIPQTIIDNYKSGRVVATGDVLKAGFAPDHLNLMHKLQIKSNLVVPIRQADKLYGLLIVHKCKTQHVWQEEEIGYLRQAGEQLGIALGGIQLAMQKQTTADQERSRSESLQRELITLLSDVEGAASGDLTVRAQITAGEIGIVADFFNAIIESLRDVVTQVKSATNSVSASVSSNDVAIRGLTEEAIAQTQQVDSALESVAQMTDSIQLVARNAQQASEASRQAEATAEVSNTAIARSVESILQLRQTVSETAKKVKRLGESSQQISKVVALIDQISLKTNMLAVNASIEAARAGEEGRGFAVVAEEVGALAAQSAMATKEIGRIVESIQQETSEVVEAMEASTIQVVEGTNQVEIARKSLEQIVAASRQVNQLFQGISSATTSQVQTSQDVRLLMERIAIVSQRSSQTSRAVSAALQETVGVASQLQASVETFKVPS